MALGIPFKIPEPEVTLVLQDRRLCRNDIDNGHGLPAVQPFGLPSAPITAESTLSLT